jgi:cellobiose-specific phosphotransferase system component IIC
MEKADPGFEAARKHLKAVRDFMYHLMVFVFVCGLLVILDVRAGVGDEPVLGLDWAYWVILFWGVGLAGHAIYAFFGDHRLEARYQRSRS